MSFWDLSDGTELDTTKTEVVASGGFEPIPDNTKVLASITDAKWKEFDGDKHIGLKWEIVSENFKKRIVFQSLKPYGTSLCEDRVKSIDRSKCMIAAIYANVGATLPTDRWPTDEELMRYLIGKIMGIHIKTYKSKKYGKLENYIAGISKKTTAASAPAADPQGRQTAAVSAPSAADFDDIPF